MKIPFGTILLLEYYPKIELELIKNIKELKVKSFVGNRLYLVKKI